MSKSNGVNTTLSSANELLFEGCKVELPCQPRILVIDDERQLLELIAATLKRSGYGCDRAASVSEARAALERSSYDIVFLDLMLPDGNGFLILEQIMNVSPQTLVLIVTGSHELDCSIEAIRKGSFDFITKPFTLELLTQRLHRVVSEWKAKCFTAHYQNCLEKVVEAKTEEVLQTTSRIESVYDAAVYALGAALDLRDPETEDHCRRVSEISLMLGERLGVDSRSRKDLKWGAYLHDVGKIGIPAEILSKPSGLTEEEMQVMRKHTVYGYNMLRNIDFLNSASVVVLRHHEKYDGSGYPDGLRGEEIPLFARIFAVVDAFDAMAWDRPYRKAMSYQDAMAELARCSGSHFDPGVIDAFVELSPEQLQIIEAQTG